MGFGQMTLTIQLPITYCFGAKKTRVVLKNSGRPIFFHLS